MNFSLVLFHSPLQRWITYFLPLRVTEERYEWRWQVELDFNIKTTLGMDILRSKTPEMIRKEIYVYLLAYNLLRTVMWQLGQRMEFIHFVSLQARSSPPG